MPNLFSPKVVSLYQKLVKNVFNPFLDFLRGTKVAACLEELEKSQWFTLDELRAIQRKRLRFLIQHAYENTSYYHRVLREKGLKPGDIKACEDLAKLPVLTKKDIKTNFDDLVALNYPRSCMTLWSTGGSTGEPTRFYVIRKHRSWETAAMLRGTGWSGYELGDKIAWLWGSLVDLSEGEKLHKRIRNAFLRQKMLNSHEMSERKMKLYADKLLEFKPKIIKGYASAVDIFARFLKNEGIDIHPEGVTTTCEKLFDHQRKRIENVFGCDVYDSYGSREVEEIATECKEHIGYHISSENVVIEFVKNGEHVAPGETGSILVTNLCNFAMPLIRYEIGDLGKPSEEICPCGRSLPLMSSVEGRIVDVIVTPEKFVSPVNLSVIFKDPSVRQFQIIQKKDSRIVVKIVKGSEYTSKDTRYIVDMLHRYLGDVEIALEFVSSIPQTESGKRRLVVSELPAKFN